MAVMPPLRAYDAAQSPPDAGSRAAGREPRLPARPPARPRSNWPTPIAATVLARRRRSALARGGAAARRRARQLRGRRDPDALRGVPRRGARVRHDIDRLRRRFAVSFEQACHRLSTLQRPDARGVAFFFCRVDMAGNITKRHSATRLQFARFGGACPLWIMHEAVAIPDRILIQLAEMPDGTCVMSSIAKGLVKKAAATRASPRRYAVALGCEIGEAAELRLCRSSRSASAPTRRRRSASPAASARASDCEQRAFPPAGRPLRIDPDRREIVPYRFG